MKLIHDASCSSTGWNSLHWVIVAVESLVHIMGTLDGGGTEGSQSSTHSDLWNFNIVVMRN